MLLYGLEPETLRKDEAIPMLRFKLKYLLNNKQNRLILMLTVSVSLLIKDGKAFSRQFKESNHTFAKMIPDPGLSRK